MKRREFLLSSAGLAGIAAPVLVRAAVPCPPPALSAVGGTSVATACEPPPSAGAAPAWFVNMPERTWATPVSNRLDDVKPSPEPQGAEGQSAVCDDWTGGTVDQDRGEFILPAQGGHDGYYGNEVYACALRSASPKWARLNNPSAVTGGVTGYNTLGNYADGAPRAVHGWNRPCWGNGKIWLAGLDGMASGPGYWSTACYSFNRSSLQWAYHGLGVPNPPTPFGSAFSWQAGPAAYDRVAKRVWSAAQYAVSDGGYSVDATTGAITRHNFVLPGNPFGGAWSVIAHDLRVWIVGSVREGRLYILDLNNPGAGFTVKATTGSPDGFVDGAGAVYHAPSRAILVWNDYGAGIRKLTVPSNPFGGTYVWSNIAPAAGNSVTPAPNPRYPSRNFSKFNIIEDMGNGRSALCLVTHTTGPTYVYKLPATI